jgi:hypothetical protein
VARAFAYPSKQLSEKLDIHGAINQVGESKKLLVYRRSDTEFEKALVNEAEIAGNLEIPTFFQEEPTRFRRKKNQFEYEGDDEHIRVSKRKIQSKLFLHRSSHENTINR